MWSRVIFSRKRLVSAVVLSVCSQQRSSKPRESPRNVTLPLSDCFLLSTFALDLSIPSFRLWARQWDYTGDPQRLCPPLACLLVLINWAGEGRGSWMFHHYLGLTQPQRYHRSTWSPSLSRCWGLCRHTKKRQVSDPKYSVGQNT